jgi:hypothetical protein
MLKRDWAGWVNIISEIAGFRLSSWGSVAFATVSLSSAVGVLLIFLIHR